MNTIRLVNYATLVATGVMLAACSSGGSSLSPGTGVAGLPAFAEGPTPLNKSRTFQYISNYGASNVGIFDYPTSHKQIDTLSGVSFPQGMCTNVLYGSGKKFFWVVASGSDSLEEFKVGGTSPVRTLTTTSEPAGCGVDPATGDIAATLFYGDVVIFKPGSSTGTVYSTPLAGAVFAGYDDRGDLYVDGSNSRNLGEVVVLQKGSRDFKPVSTGVSSAFGGNVQWDGKYLTVGSQDAQAIYRFAIHGTSLKLKGTVKLNGTDDCVQTWIGNGELLCPDTLRAMGYVFKYPAGGSAIATLAGNYVFDEGSVEATK